MGSEFDTDDSVEKRESNAYACDDVSCVLKSIEVVQQVSKQWANEFTKSEKGCGKTADNIVQLFFVLNVRVNSLCFGYGGYEGPCLEEAEAN